MTMGSVTFVIVIMFLLLTSSYGPLITRTIEISVYRGQDALFNLTLPNPVLYAHFGEKKKGFKEPNPNIIVVDKDNKHNKIGKTEYSDRLTYDGNSAAGHLLFVLNNTQVNDSRTFTIYLREVGSGAMYNVDFKLQVKEPSPTNPPTVNPTNATPTAEKNETEAEKGTSPPNTTSKPSNSTPGSTPDDGNLLKVLLPLVLVLLVVVGVVAAVFCYRNMKTTKSSRNQKALKDITNDESYCPLDSREDIIGNADIWTGHAQDLNNGNDDVEDHGTVSTRDFTDNHLNYESEINGDSPTGLGIGISNSTDSETDPLNESNEMNGDDDVVPKGPGIIREL